MRVGILTASRTNNNGTDLQAAAMYKIFKQVGFDVEVIDYACEKLDRSKKILPSFSIKSFLRVPWRLFRNLSHESFRRKEFRHSAQTYFPETLSLDSYDAIVVGSDQVWNLMITGYDTNFFLPSNIGKMKRFSYAVSLGKINISEWENDFKLSSLLSAFDGVSVRESSGVRALQDIGITAREDLDPLLCLDRSEWEGMSSKTHIRRPYVLLYLVEECKEAERIAIDYAKKRQMDVVRIGCLNKPIKGVRTKSFVSVPKWIGLMNKADMVFTNSYHGLSTSIALNTNFRFFMLRNEEHNTRALCLLEKIRLREFVYRYTDVDSLEKHPDWRVVNETVLELRNQSIDYIKSIMLG